MEKVSRVVVCSVGWLWMMLAAPAAEGAQRLPHSMDEPRMGGPVRATFSIVARDPKTGELGFALKSRAFRAGAQYTFAETGVGVAVAQAYPDFSQMPKALKLLRKGLMPAQVVQQLMDGDKLKDWRQLAVIDHAGHTAAYTGAKTYFASGQISDTDFSVQGNLLESERVVPAMAKGFRESHGELAERMLAALDAGQAEGGDGRAYSGASILVVKPGYMEMGDDVDPDHIYRYWVDLRVDYAKDSLAELHFLLRYNQASHLAEDSMGLMRAGKKDESVKVQEAALALDPEDDELQYELAERYGEAGRLTEALALLRKVFRTSPNMRSYAARSESFKTLEGNAEFGKLVSRE